MSTFHINQSTTKAVEINQIFTKDEITSSITLEETATIATILPLNYSVIEEVVMHEEDEQDIVTTSRSSIHQVTPQIQLQDTTALSSIIDESADETTTVGEMTMPTPTTELNQLLLEPHSQVAIAAKSTRELVEIGVKNALSQEMLTTNLNSKSIQPEVVIATTIGFIVLSIVTCMAIAIVLLRKRLRSIRVFDNTLAPA